MNKNINNTLQALVPILRMNGEKVKSIEAVEDWYWHIGHEYMKEVAEITYDSGYRKYADIGCDSNLTACYDVLAVIQQIKRPSTVIERIERGVYEEVAECRMSDLIDRQMAINNAYEICLDGDVFKVVQVETLIGLPSVEPKRNSGWWVPRDHNKQIANGVYTAMYTFPICSECGRSGRIEYAFCPHCGAEMNGGDS